MLVVLLVAVTACAPRAPEGGAASEVRDEHGGRLTPTQAGRASRMLYGNFLAGGASVEISVAYSSALAVAMSGEVDWRDHRGRLTVKTVESGRGRVVWQRLVFTPEAVYTQAATERPDRARSVDGRWVRRAPDPSGHPIDSVIALVVGLAAIRPDNPLLVRQGVLRFARSDVVAGSRVDVFTDPAKGVAYWVDRRTGALRRVRGTLPGFVGPCVIDLSRHRHVRVAVPPI